MRKGAVLSSSLSRRFGALLMSSSASAAVPGRPITRSASMLSTSAAMSAFATHQPIAQRAMQYFDASPDPFFATETACKRLADAGFVKLDERDAWSAKLKPGGKYYFTRNRSCLVAFAVGGGYEPGGGFKVIGAHTDSPNLRIKPRSKRKSSGCLQLEVECYGGGLWHTWFDRDLSVSGRVMVRSESGRGIEQRLVRIDRPVLRVPTLCIHLQSPEEREAFKVNKEDHLQPILATEALKTLDGTQESEQEAQSPTDEEAQSTGDGEASPPASTAEMAEPDAGGGATDESSTHTWENGQEPLLVQMLADELGVPTERIVDFEMSLHDVQKAAISGIHNEVRVLSWPAFEPTPCHMSLPPRHPYPYRPPSRLHRVLGPTGALRLARALAPVAPAAPAAKAAAAAPAAAAAAAAGCGSLSARRASTTSPRASSPSRLY